MSYINSYPCYENPQDSSYNMLPPSFGQRFVTIGYYWAVKSSPRHIEMDTDKYHLNITHRFIWWLSLWLCMWRQNGHGRHKPSHWGTSIVRQTPPSVHAPPITIGGMQHKQYIQRGGLSHAPTKCLVFTRWIFSIKLHWIQQRNTRRHCDTTAKLHTFVTTTA
jgi:hypothetical protein